MKFTIDEALDYSSHGFLQEWVHGFLETEGRNPHLARIMKDKGYWLGIFEFPLSNLVRCCGPEENMKFHEDPKKWDETVTKMTDKLKSGWRAPPLIVWHLNGVLSVADGNHRFEAMKRNNYKKYWIIIWFEELKDFENFKILNKIN